MSTKLALKTLKRLHKRMATSCNLNNEGLFYINYIGVLTI